jgi:exodeoxyribonuclease VII small subunit
MKKNPETPIEEMSYEQAFAELEEIVNNLEMNQPSLEEAIKIFERGQLLSKHCTSLLGKADLKIRNLTGQEIDGISS